jgi:hypothetical protein
VAAIPPLRSRKKMPSGIRKVRLPEYWGTFLTDLLLALRVPVEQVRLRPAEELLRKRRANLILFKRL